MAIARHVRALETIDFHAGRYWPLEVALWDIAGQVAGLPVAALFGCVSYQLRAPSSAAERAEAALRLREEGFRALKIRIDPRHRTGPGGVVATRAAVGETMAIMVDLNQGVPGDTSTSQPGRCDGSPPCWPSTACCGSRSRCWARTCAGWPPCAQRHPDRVAGGEMTRTFAESLAALDADAFDVYQPDAVLAVGTSARARWVSWLWPAIAGSAPTDGRWPTSMSRASCCSSSSPTIRPTDTSVGDAFLDRAHPTGQRRAVTAHPGIVFDGGGHHGRGMTTQALTASDGIAAWPPSTGRRHVHRWSSAAGRQRPDLRRHRRS